MTDAFDARIALHTRVNALALVPAPFLAAAILLPFFGTPPLWPLLLGAAGWMVALIARQPVGLIASRTTTMERTTAIVGWMSGPAEELVRLGLVLWVIRSVEDAVWAGFGWAAIEVVMIAVNTLVIASLMTRDDPKSREARQLLATQDMIVPSNPVWGLLERFSAIALHLGFTLLLFAQPWLVLVTLPVHSLVNMLTVRFAKTHLAATEAALAGTAAFTLAAGLLAATL